MDPSALPVTATFPHRDRSTECTAPEVPRPVSLRFQLSVGQQNLMGFCSKRFQKEQPFPPQWIGTPLYGLWLKTTRLHMWQEAHTHNTRTHPYTCTSVKAGYFKRGIEGLTGSLMFSQCQQAEHRESGAESESVTRIGHQEVRIGNQQSETKNADSMTRKFESVTSPESDARISHQNCQIQHLKSVTNI